MKAREIMVTDFPVVSVQTSIEDAVKMLRSHHDESLLHAAPGLIVLNERGDLAGILSPLTIIRVILEAAGKPGKGAAADSSDLKKICSDLKGKTVEDVMDWQPISVTEDAGILDLADLFVKHRFQRIPVVKGKKVLGVIYRSHLLSAMTDCLK
jgi:CBS domain-containing protein